MKYYITFNYNNQGRNDRIVGCIDGKSVTRYWNKHKLPDITLTQEFTWSTINQLSAMDIQAGVFMVAGIEAQNISDLRIFQDDRNIEEIVNG